MAMRNFHDSRDKWTAGLGKNDCLRNPPVSLSVYNKHQYDLYTHIFKLIIVLGHGCFF